MSSFAALLDRVRVRLALLLARGAVQRTSNAASGCWPTVQAALLTGEVKPLQHRQPYGFASRVRPPDGAGGGEVLAGFLNGDRSHGFAFGVGDRRFQVALTEGEVAIHDDLGQKVHLTRDGIVIHGAGRQITITGTPKLRIEAELEVTGGATLGGDLVAAGEVADAAGSLTEMRGVFNPHYHTYAGLSGNTSVPTVPMD